MVLCLSFWCATGRASTWTVLIYMAADNDLWDEALDDLAELEEVGSTSEVTVVAQADLRGSTAKRLLVQRDRSRVIRDLGEMDSGDPEALTDFGIWGIIRYPSDHYLLVIWDHGNGWFNEIGAAAGQRAQEPPAITTGVGYDCSSGNSIGVADGELKDALEEIASHLRGGIDVLGFDACSMQLLEVAYEVKDAARILVGSEELVPLDGWPYNDILRVLALNPGLSPEELADLIVETYVDSYQGGSQGTSEVTLSAVDLGQMEELEEGVGDFSEHLLDWASGSLVQQARQDVQSFYMGISPPFLAQDYIDLTHFAQLIRDGSSGELWESASSLAAVLGSSIISNGHTGESVEDAWGLSIWFPEYYLAFVNNHLDYKDLGLAAATSWETFLYKSYGVPDTIPPTVPEISSMGLLSANSFMVRWQESYDLSGVSSYELREVSGLSSLLSDDCEGSTAAWELTGFVQSEGNCHTPSHSYFSHLGEMVTRERLYPSAGGELAFWCCYRGRQGSEFLVLEISADGTNWQPLDSLTGTEPDWVRRNYELSRNAVVGIYIRFRYESDGAPDRWVFLDDIEAVGFGSSRVLSASIEGDFFPVLDRARGQYFCQLRATDSYGNLSSWSEYGAIWVPGLTPPYNYPNPFGAGGTTIQLSIINDQIPMSLKIYDIAGRLIRTLGNEPSNHPTIQASNRIFWDGRDSSGKHVPSGVYSYLVNTGSRRRTGKAVCIR